MASSVCWFRPILRRNTGSVVCFTLSQGTRSLKRSLQLRETQTTSIWRKRLQSNFRRFCLCFRNKESRGHQIQHRFPRRFRLCAEQVRPWEIRCPRGGAVLAKAQLDHIRRAPLQSPAKRPPHRQQRQKIRRQNRQPARPQRRNPIRSWRCSPAPTQAVSTIPASIPKDSVPQTPVPKTPRPILRKKNAKETVAIQASDAKTPELFVAASKSDPVRIRRPAGAVGLLIGGGALLLAGVGTGIETLLVAKQVSQPTADGHFDKQLDQQEKP